MSKLLWASCLILLAISPSLTFIGDIIYNIKAILGFGGLFKIQAPLSATRRTQLGYNEDTRLDFIEVATKYGYEAETHTVTTEDGYILTLHRLSRENCPKAKGTPVLLMHGVMMCSQSFLDAGPGAALAYLLADACFDVWLGNNRGNHYSRAHATLNPDTDKQFWLYSTDEMGYYDQPAMIDYILEETSSGALNYIGYSQGATNFLIMCTERQEYCDKANIAILLAPASRFLNCKSRLMRLLFTIYGSLENVFDSLNIYEVLSRQSIEQTLLEFTCQMGGKVDLLFTVCKRFLYTLDSHNQGSISDETFQTIFSHIPVGMSVRSMAKWYQALSVEVMRKYDYGTAEGNMAVYGSVSPPVYDLTTVSTPVVLLIGMDDQLINIEDITWLRSQLPNVLEMVTVNDEKWNHVDMVFSKKIKDHILPPIVNYLSIHTSKIVSGAERTASVDYLTDGAESVFTTSSESTHSGLSMASGYTRRITGFRKTLASKIAEPATVGNLVRIPHDGGRFKFTSHLAVYTNLKTLIFEVPGIANNETSSIAVYCEGSNVVKGKTSQYVRSQPSRGFLTMFSFTVSVWSCYYKFADLTDAIQESTMRSTVSLRVVTLGLGQSVSNVNGNLPVNSPGTRKSFR